MAEDHAPHPTPRQLGDAIDTLMDLCDHLAGTDLDKVRAAIQVLQARLEGHQP